MENIPNDSPFVLVENIPKSVTKDTLIIHFQKKKNGGGDIFSLKFLKDQKKTGKKSAIIQFEDITDAENVLKQLQIINNNKLDVSSWKLEIFSEARVKISNDTLQRFAEYNNESFNMCLLKLCKSHRFSFILERDSKEWTIIGEWQHLKLLKHRIDEALKLPPPINALVSFEEDSMEVSKTYWDMLVSEKASHLLKIFIETFLNIKEINNMLNISTCNKGISLLKNSIKNFGGSIFPEVVDSLNLNNINDFSKATSLNKKSTNIIKNTKYFSNSVKVSFCHGDITKESVHTIVNAANEDLEHIGGVAAAILKAGGNTIKDFCQSYIKNYGQITTGNFMVSPAGNLPCSKIVHAVGPQWHKYGMQSSYLLKKLFYNIFKHCDGSTSSLALPLISSGVYGVPKNVVARCLLEAIGDFSKGDVKTLKDIRFIDPDEKLVEFVISIFNDEKYIDFSDSAMDNERNRNTFPINQMFKSQPISKNMYFHSSDNIPNISSVKTKEKGRPLSYDNIEPLCASDPQMENKLPEEKLNAKQPYRLANSRTSSSMKEDISKVSKIFFSTEESADKKEHSASESFFTCENSDT